MTVVAIAAGAEHALALTDGGTIVSWGNAPSPPEGLSNVAAIAAGNYISLALLSDGTVVGWGSTEVPEGLSDVAAITAGGLVCFATLSDGSVVGWKKRPFHYFDPCEPAVWPEGSLPTADSIDGGFALGFGPGGGALHVKVENGQMDSIPPLPTAWELPITDLSAGYAHALAVNGDGEVLSWAHDGHLRSHDLATPRRVSHATAVAAGGAFSMALLASGEIEAWGHNGYGQTEVPAGLGNVIAVAAGRHFGVALTDEGSVVAWGRNDKGQTDVPQEIAATPHGSAVEQSVGPLALVGQVEPRALITNGYPDERSEVKLSALASEEALLELADEWINLSYGERYQVSGRLNGACLYNNLAARQILRGELSRAIVYLEGADLALGQIPRDPDDASELVSAALLAPVARATIAFNYALAQLRLGNHNEYRRGVAVVVDLLTSVTGHWLYGAGTSVGDRVDFIRRALPRLFDESVS